MTEPTGAWQPANDAERAMAQALAADDRREYFRLLATTDLYLPQVSEESEESGGAQTFITGEMFGRTVLPVYTSLEGLTAALAGVADAYTVTNAPQLLELWPQPDWQLAVNPGYPIDAYLPIETLMAAAQGTVRVPTAAEAVVDGFGEDPQAATLLDTAELVRGAAERGDPAGYIDALLDAVVIVPTGHAVEDPETLLDADRPWRPAGPAEAPAVEVFTSEETFAAAFEATGGAQVHSVTMPFVLLLGVWPQGHALSVDPRTDLAVDLPADQVQLMLLWSPEEGPDEATDEVTEEGPDEATGGVTGESGDDRGGTAERGGPTDSGAPPVHRGL